MDLGKTRTNKEAEKEEEDQEDQDDEGGKKAEEAQGKIEGCVSSYRQ